MKPAEPKGPRVVIRGIKGFLAGEERVLEVGDALVIGRSRAADLSTRNSYLLNRRTDRLSVIKSEPFKSVSRRHVRIHFLHPGLVEIKDMSSNGTFLDGRRIDCVAVTDLDSERHILSLGSQERLFVEMVSY